MRVELVVDEIVLHGVDPRERHRIGDAIERQLQARLARGTVVDRIASDARSREHVLSDIVTQSVRAAMSPTAPRGRNG